MVTQVHVGLWLMGKFDANAASANGWNLFISSSSSEQGFSISTLYSGASKAIIGVH